jgi:hypothetical protein
LILLSALAARPLSTANVSAAGIFRIVDEFHPTLLVDEADIFLSGYGSPAVVSRRRHARRHWRSIRRV